MRHFLSVKTVQCLILAVAVCGCDEQHADPLPVKPVSADDSVWQQFLSPDVPYYNASGSPVTARAAPGLTSPPVGTVEPGEGGFVETCTADAEWCEISFGGAGETGWVPMSKFGGRAL